MKTVLVYGDSNTWGAKAGAILRYSHDERWVNVLQKKLGDEYRVSAHGLVGRYAGGFVVRPSVPLLNGQLPYEAIYRAAAPVDIAIIALGGNDVNDKYDRSPDDIVDDILWYENKTQELLDGKSMPTFVYILQPNFAGPFDGPFGKENFNAEKRNIVNEELKKKVKNYVEVEDADLSEDELHFSPVGHEQMADAVYDKIMEIEK